jgi:hypothetical protein
MSSQVEYLFAAAVTIADQAARALGWQPRGRADGLKPDGTAARTQSRIKDACFSGPFICRKRKAPRGVGSGLPTARLTRDATRLPASLQVTGYAKLS